MGGLNETITNTNQKLTIGDINNDTDDEFDIGMSSVLNTLSMLDAAIQDINAELITIGSNNNTNNELDTSMLGVLDTAIKNTDAEPIGN